jgi:hypothetical protein
MLYFVDETTREFSTKKQIINLEDHYDLAFLNDGNREIMITSVVRSQYRLTQSEIHHHLDEANVCSNKHSYGSWPNSYRYKDINKEGHDVMVVVPEDFYLIRELTFPGNLNSNSFPKDESAVLLTCLEISYVKTNGSTGQKILPAGTAQVEHLSDGLRVSVFAPVRDLQSVD